MSPQSCIIVSLLLLTPFTSSAPLDTRANQQPLPATYHAPDPADANTFATLNYHAPPENPRNKTCLAADTACVVGVSTSKRSEDLSSAAEQEKSKRSGGVQEAEQNAGIDDLTNANSGAIVNNTNVTETTHSSSGSDDGVCSAADTECVVGKRAGGVQEAAQQAGINRLNNNNQAVIEQNSTQPNSGSSTSSSKPSNGICSAADTACVTGASKRDAEDLDARIQKLRAELDHLKEKRQTASLAVPGVKPRPNTSNGVGQPPSGTAAEGSSATNSTTGPKSTTTNAFGRLTCPASDVDCVTGAT